MAHRAQEGLTPQHRVIAFEVRSRSFGFVVLEGVSLLDWGVHRTRETKRTIEPILEKANALLDRYEPRFVVMGGRPRPTRMALALFDAIKRQADEWSIETVFVYRAETELFFYRYECVSRHAIASALAGSYAELAARLPPKRKLGHHEPYNTLVFDALATAVTFLGRT